MKNRRPLWIALLTVALILAVWTSLGGQGLTNAVTRGVVAGANWILTGSWDFSGGTIKLEGGACPPAASGCDAADATEEKRIFVCSDEGTANQDIYVCSNDSNGWYRVVAENNVGAAVINGVFEMLGQTRIIDAATGVGPDLEIRKTSGGDDAIILFNTAGTGDWRIYKDDTDSSFRFQVNSSDKTLVIENIGAGDANLDVIGDLSIDQSATATDAILNFKTSGAGTVSESLDDSTKDMVTTFNDQGVGGVSGSGHRWQIFRNIANGLWGVGGFPGQNGGAWPEGLRVGDSEFYDGTKKDCSDVDLNRGIICTVDSDCHNEGHCSVTIATECFYLGGNGGDCPPTETCVGDGDGSCDAAISEWFPATLMVNEGSPPVGSLATGTSLFNKSGGQTDLTLFRPNISGGLTGIRIVDSASNTTLFSLGVGPHTDPEFGIKTVFTAPKGVIEISGPDTTTDEALFWFTEAAGDQHGNMGIINYEDNVTAYGSIGNHPDFPRLNCNVDNNKAYRWWFSTMNTKFQFKGAAEDGAPIRFELENNWADCAGGTGWDGTETYDPMEWWIWDSVLGYAGVKSAAILGIGGFWSKPFSTVPQKCKDGDRVFHSNSGAPRDCCCDPTQDGDGVYEICDGSGTAC